MAKGPLYVLHQGSATSADLADGPFHNMFPGSTEYHLDPTNGSDANTGLSKGEAFATLPVAYAALTANQNDILYYHAGPTSISLSAKLTWAKSYTHFIGACAPTAMANRARIFQTAAATGLSPLIDITGSGCVFKNFYVFQGVDDATSLINVQVTGGRNYFQDIHFAGGGHATMAINGGASLKLDAAEENRFVNCTIGVDTIDSADGHVGLLFDSEAHRNKFEGCAFTMSAGNAGAAFAEVADATGIDRYTVFDRCLFSNVATGTAMTSAIVMPAGMGAPRRIYIWDPLMVGAADWDANDRGVIYLNAGTITAGGNAGIAQPSAAA